MEAPQGIASSIARRIVHAGDITEITGPLSSGRTSLLVACLGAFTREGAAVALVDTDHAFDPGSAVRAGLDLRRLLWVRCGGYREVALRVTDLLVRCPGFAVVALDAGETPPRLPASGAFRLKLAARRTGVALLVLARRRITGSSAALALESVPAAPRWAGPGPTPTRLAVVHTRFQVVRGPGAAPLACEWVA